MRKPRLKNSFLHKWMAVSGIISCASTFASPPAMVAPAIDDHPGQPFSYFSKSVDEIGVMDAQAATEITPEGYLYTGFGELMFFAGPQKTPVEQRIRTLEDGYLPIVHYTYRQDGLAYRFTMFTASLNGQPDGTLVNFIRVNILNENKHPARADFAVGMRYANDINANNGLGDNRFMRPHKESKLGDYRQLGEKFNPDWVYGFSGDQFLRNGKIMYLFPEGAQEKSLTLYDSENGLPDTTPRALNILPTTPVGIVSYDKVLQPGEDYSLVFKMPVIPLKADHDDLALLKNAGMDSYQQQVSAIWKNLVDRGMQIRLPEKKAVETFNASLVYDLMARDKIGLNYIQTVNKLHYHEFFLRDVSDIAHMYDVTGYSDISRQVLDFFARSQQPDGNFVSQKQQYDGWGETLWAYGQHYRMTGDKKFAEKVMPSIRRAVDWLKQARQDDELHLIISSDVRDNEDIPGHITGYNFLALAGLKNAIIMAEDLGDTKDAEDFRKEYQDYRKTLMDVLAPITAKTGGYIPPALDGNNGGQDWGNLLGAYPENTIDPWDPRITATLKTAHAKYQEGIMTYGDGRWLHHYLTIKNALTELIRGDQEDVIREYYGLLLHTSSTQAGFEYNIRPWGDRNFQRNLPPHGWFAAEFRTLTRNMLVREYDGQVHLLSAVSPEWIGARKEIAATNVPTEFGRISYVVKQPDNNSAVISINSDWRKAPGAIVIHLPWFMDVSSVSVDGKPASIDHNQVTLSADAKKVQIDWKRKPDAPELSYQKAVADYKAEYRKRYESFMNGTA